MRVFTIITPLVLLGSTIHAAVYPIANRFVATDSVRWEDALSGPYYNPGDFTLANPFAITSVPNHINVLVSNDGNGPFAIYTQGADWFGTFNPGEILLTTGGSPGPIAMEFSQPLRAAGLEIQLNSLLLPYSATVQAFDIHGVLLGERTVAIADPDMTTAPIFLGIGSDLDDIVKLTFNASSADGSTSDFAVNWLDIKSVAVPESSTWIAGFSTLVFWGIYALRNSKTGIKT